MATHLEPDRRFLVSLFQGCHAPIRVGRLPQRQHSLCFLINNNKKFQFVCLFSTVNCPRVGAKFPVFSVSGKMYFQNFHTMVTLFLVCISHSHTTCHSHAHTHTCTHTHTQNTTFSLRPLFSAPVVEFGC